MPTPQKAAAISELTDQLERSRLAIITDYRGLSVTDLQGLRSSLRPIGAEFHIAKNTLTEIAANRAGIEGLAPLLEGPTALLFAYEDAVAASKVISDFARTSRILTVRGGIMSRRILTAPEIEELATLPPREVLLGRVVGMFASPMSRTVGVLGGPSRSVAYLLQARAEQLGGGQGQEQAAAD